MAALADDESTARAADFSWALAFAAGTPGWELALYFCIFITFVWSSGCDRLEQQEARAGRRRRSSGGGSSASASQDGAAEPIIPPVLATGQNTWFPLAALGIVMWKGASIAGNAANHELDNIIALLRNPNVLGTLRAALPQWDPSDVQFTVANVKSMIWEQQHSGKGGAGKYRLRGGGERVGELVPGITRNMRRWDYLAVEVHTLASNATLVLAVYRALKGPILPPPLPRTGRPPQDPNTPSGVFLRNAERAEERRDEDKAALERQVERLTEELAKVAAEAEALKAPSVFSRSGLQTVAKTLHEVLDKRVSRDAAGDDLLAAISTVDLTPAQKSALSRARRVLHTDAAALREVLGRLDERYRRELDQAMRTSGGRVGAGHASKQLYALTKLLNLEAVRTWGREEEGKDFAWALACHAVATGISRTAHQQQHAARKVCCRPSCTHT